MNNNTVTTTTGSDPDGIYIKAYRNGRIDTAEISGNIVSTEGVQADDIKLFASQGGQITNATISNNTITQAGYNGIHLQTTNEPTAQQSQTLDGTMCVTLSGNNVQNSYVAPRKGLSGADYSFVNVVGLGESLSISGSDPNTVINANSPSNASAYSVTGDLTFVSSCP